MHKTLELAVQRCVPPSLHQCDTGLVKWLLEVLPHHNLHLQTVHVSYHDRKKTKMKRSIMMTPKYGEEQLSHEETEAHNLMAVLFQLCKSCSVAFETYICRSCGIWPELSHISTVQLVLLVHRCKCAFKRPSQTYPANMNDGGGFTLWTTVSGLSRTYRNKVALGHGRLLQQRFSRNLSSTYWIFTKE